VNTADRRERDKQEMRRDVLKAAMDLFVEAGYDRVSVRRIAERIGYSPGTIYLYFENKDEILYHLHEEGFRRLIARQQEILAEPDPSRRLQRMGEAYMRFALENSQYYELMFLDRSPLRQIEQDWDCGMQSLDLLRQTIRACVDAGQMQDVDIEMATFATWSSVHGLASLVLRDRFKMVPEEHIEGLIAGVLSVFHQKMTG
jgi:AcrR family transcriptional regulator